MKLRDLLLLLAACVFSASAQTTGVTRTAKNGKYGFVDQQGKTVIPFMYYDLGYGWENGLAKAMLDGKWGMIDKNNRTVIPFEYEAFGFDWSEGVISAQKDKKWGFINAKNTVIIPFEYGEAEPFSEGLAFVERARKEGGYIDHHHKVIIPLIYQNYSSLSNFRNGTAVVEKDGMIGFIDKSGSEIIPFKYSSATNFCRGYASVETGNMSYYKTGFKSLEFGYIDTAGKELLLPVFDWKNPEWGTLSKAPVEIPDYSDTLFNHIPVHYGMIMLEVTKSIDASGKEMPPDTAYFGNFYENDTLISRQFTEIEKANYKRGYVLKKWTLEQVVEQRLHALRQEPRHYGDLCRLNNICTEYGLMLGQGNYFDFMYPDDRWEIFKKETLFKIISSEYLRNITWDWVMPYFRKSFDTMHPFHKKAYKEIATYLKNYINSYDRAKVEAYLKRDERRFARYDINGKHDPHRKLSAWVDRLIIMHRVLEVDDAKVWINKIADEVKEW